MSAKYGIASVVALLISTDCFASAKEAERLAGVAADYAKCANVVLANFESDKEAQKVSKLFYVEIIKKIGLIVDLELADGNKNVVYNIDVMGRDVLIGYMLKGFIDVGEDFQSSKRKLTEENNWDWRKTNNQLWSKYGCGAIYEGLR